MEPCGPQVGAPAAASSTSSETTATVGSTRARQPVHGQPEVGTGQERRGDGRSGDRDRHREHGQHRRRPHPEVYAEPVGLPAGEQQDGAHQGRQDDERDQRDLTHQPFSSAAMSVMSWPA